MKFSASLSLAGLAASALAGPVELTKRGGASWCGNYGISTDGPYTITHNNWGVAKASGGSQCTTFDPVQGNSISWTSKWSWSGGPGDVKAYPWVGLNNVNRRLSDVKSIPSRWSWSYSGSNLVADVAYDLWLAPALGAANKYEIMVWLAALGGAAPISTTGRTPIATVQIAGSAWHLFKGPNGDTTVFSFVAAGNINNFNGDLNLFFKYLTSSQGVPTSSVVTSLQAGTEPFTGQNAVFRSTVCSISIS
ncbi:hypothetical protein E4U21_004971 [Claviceps maximensis]|nr:hypothetical protein E4U21_004971 [Claviceps maximensis]